MACNYLMTVFSHRVKVTGTMPVWLVFLYLYKQCLISGIQPLNILEGKSMNQPTNVSVLYSVSMFSWREMFNFEESNCFWFHHKEQESGSPSNTSLWYMNSCQNKIAANSSHNLWQLRLTGNLTTSKNLPGDKPLIMCVRESPDCVHRSGRPHPQCRLHHSMGWASN